MSARPGPHPLWPGTVGPALTPHTPLPHARRRATTLDIEHVDPQGERLQIAGRGHDVRWDEDGRGEVVDQADFRAASSPRGLDITEIHTREPVLVAPLHLGPRGLRGQVAEQAPDLAWRAPLLHQLLDDVPIFQFVARGSLLRTGRIPVAAAPPFVPDLCAGWRSDGMMVREAEEGQRTLRGEGPVLPDGAAAALLGDPPGPPPALPPGSVRRTRIVDVSTAAADGGREVRALYRDSFFEEDGAESVIHEYGVELSVDADHVVRAATAVPHVLPGPDCPVAAASAGRVVGLPLAEVAGHVRRTMRGPTTCVHLNDTFVALAHVDLRSMG